MWEQVHRPFDARGDERLEAAGDLVRDGALDEALVLALEAESRHPSARISSYASELHELASAWRPDDRAVRAD